MKTDEKNDNLLPAGLRFFNPPEAAPDFVIGTMVVTMNELFDYCKKNPDLITEYEGKKQLKVQLLVAKSGKLYGKVDDYKKEEVTGKVPSMKKAAKTEEAADVNTDDDLPF